MALMENIAILLTSMQRSPYTGNRIWPCWLCSSKLALWRDKDYVWIGAGVVEKQARKHGLLELKSSSSVKRLFVTHKPPA